MESNEQTELTSKNGTASCGGQMVLRGAGIEQKGKRTHGNGQQCGDYGGE